MPVSVTVGKESYQYTFTVAGDTVRIVAWDTTVMTLPKDEWLTAIAASDSSLEQAKRLEKAVDHEKIDLSPDELEVEAINLGDVQALPDSTIDSIIRKVTAIREAWPESPAGRSRAIRERVNRGCRGGRKEVADGTELIYRMD